MYRSTFPKDLRPNDRVHFTGGPDDRVDYVETLTEPFVTQRATFTHIFHGTNGRVSYAMSNSAFRVVVEG
jgi:hypothetical protein